MPVGVHHAIPVRQNEPTNALCWNISREPSIGPGFGKQRSRFSVDLQD